MFIPVFKVHRHTHCDFLSTQAHIQLATMKQNSCPIVGEVAKSSGVSFDDLNRAIKPFGSSIVDSLLTVY